MAQVLTALAGALRDLREPRIIAIVLLPMLGSISIWVILSWIFWDSWTAWLNGLAAGTTGGRWLEGVGAGWLLQGLSTLGVIVLVAPATLITALVINEIVAMPAIVSHVAGRYYPRLDRGAGGTPIGSALNATIGIAIFCLLWVVTLPLWFTGVGALVLPALTSAYLNQRLLRYDALAEHAGRDEYRQVLARMKGKLYLLGLLVALLYYVPIVNLLAPVASGLAFTHLCLAELAHLRQGD